MTIHTWSNFTKRRNSTKRPTGGTPVTAVLKEGTSVENPTFLLNSNDFSINYVTAFNHCYFVDDITSVRNNLIEVKCSMDVGATYKTDIENYNALIERSASFYDESYPDPAVSIQNSSYVVSVDSTITHLDYDGYFALTVLNNAGSETGFTVTYFVKDTVLRDIARYVNTDWGSAATDILSWLQATFLRTADCIVDCRWLPITTSAFSSDASNEQIVIGVDALSIGGSPIYGYRLAYPHINIDSNHIDIPYQYYAQDFRNFSPYTIAKLYIPCYGVVDINILDFPGGSIYYKYMIDVQTGDTAVILASDDAYQKIISTYTFNISVQCPVGRVGINTQGFMSSGLTTSAMVAGAMALPSKFTMAAGIATGASAINTMGAMLGVTASVNGSQGGRVLAYDQNMILTVEIKNTQDPDTLIDEAGRICMEKHVINTCSGYVKCVNADVPIAGMASDKEQVNNLLNNGFYYE